MRSAPTSARSSPARSDRFPAERRRAVKHTALLLALVSTRAVAAPDERGPHPVGEHDLNGTLVYYPDDAPTPGPVVAVVHGAGRSGHYHEEMGKTLASRGMVAVVPDLPCLTDCDFDANADRVNE